MRREYTINLGDPKFVPSDHPVTSIRIEPEHGYDKVTIWNRGANAGTLSVREGDGSGIVSCLFAHRPYKLVSPETDQ